MGYSKISVTIPDQTYRQIKALAAREGIKLSHLVTDALEEKARTMKEEAYLQRINDVFGDPEVGEEQKRMAESIADTTDVEELPW